MKKSWRTTTSGIISILLGGLAIAGPVVSGGGIPPAENLTGAIGLIIAGIGLLNAKDLKVTGTPEEKK